MLLLGKVVAKTWNLLKKLKEGKGNYVKDSTSVSIMGLKPTRNGFKLSSNFNLESQTHFYFIALNCFLFFLKLMNRNHRGISQYLVQLSVYVQPNIKAESRNLHQASRANIRTQLHTSGPHCRNELSKC